MSPDLGALVASPHFRWRVGLPVQESAAVDGGGFVVFVSLQGFPTVEDSNGWRNREHPRDIAPVTDDPFFKGWLLHLVREAWAAHWAKRPGSGTPVVVIERVSGGWRWRLMSCRIDGDGDDSVSFCDCGDIVATERDAACAALLAAPPKETS